VQDAAGLDTAFFVTAGALLVAGGIAAFLPGRLIRETSAH
jgi:hypothetical protein